MHGIYDIAVDGTVEVAVVAASVQRDPALPDFAKEPVGFDGDSRLQNAVNATVGDVLSGILVSAGTRPILDPGP